MKPIPSNSRLPVFDSQRGQGLVEYSLVLALIAIVSIGILTRTGGTMECGLEILNYHLYEALRRSSQPPIMYPMCAMPMAPPPLPME